MTSRMTLRIHMTDGTTFEFRHEYGEVSENIIARIRGGKGVYGTLKRGDAFLGNDIWINPACITWTERCSGESEKGWKAGWTVIEAPRQASKVEYVPIRMDTTPILCSYPPQTTCDTTDRSVRL